MHTRTCCYRTLSYVPLAYGTLPVCVINILLRIAFAEGITSVARHATFFFAAYFLLPFTLSAFVNHFTFFLFDFIHMTALLVVVGVWRMLHCYCTNVESCERWHTPPYYSEALREREIDSISIFVEFMPCNLCIGYWCVMCSSLFPFSRTHE